MGAFDELMAYQRRTEALGQIAGRLAWDRETVMPQGAAGQRAEEIGAIEAVLHARRTDQRLGEWLERAEPPDEAGVAQLREIRRSHERACRVPVDLAMALAQLASRAQGVWAQARALDDPGPFLPMLEEMVRLRREEAAALAEGRGGLYDALLEEYEPGATEKQLVVLFGSMRPRLVALRERALAMAEVAPLQGHFAEAEQFALARDLALRFGYDLTRGRIDRAVHPFSSGSGDDVRITIRIDEADPFNCIHATIHETGHAAYEQAIDPAFRLTPLGRGVSMGVHESQSRIYENQIGRGRGFCRWLFGEMRRRFGEIGVADEAGFYAAVNRVHRGYIRTEADEVQYNLHVMLRFDLERALIGGDLTVRDLEAAWNDRFEADFGYPVDRPSNGLLQDVHWSQGLFGYFPTYSLGNVYAGCLWEALCREVPDLEAALERGEPGPATAWLRDRVQRMGGLYLPRDLIARATGGAQISAEPLLAYLEEKFGALYPA